MRSRAIALSIAAHLTLLAAIVWRSFSSPTSAPTELQAPLGSVFVEEQRGAPSPIPAAEETALEGTAAKPAASPGSAASPQGVSTGEAEPIGEIHPGYPPLSRKLGEEGEAVFLLKIMPSGAVENAELAISSGHSRLDEAAKSALLAARFKNENGTALSKRFRVEFRLSGSR